MPEPKTFIHNLCRAIATGEGFFVSGSLPSRMFNPGDLRAAPWLVGAKVVNGFVKFDNLGLGIAGLYHQVALDVARGYSLRKLIYTYAPPSDGNDSENYLKETARRVGIDFIKDIDTPLYTFLALEILP